MLLLPESTATLPTICQRCKRPLYGYEPKGSMDLIPRWGWSFVTHADCDYAASSPWQRASEWLVEGA